MQLTPLYRMQLNYPRGWSVDLSGAHGTESQHFYFVEGRCDGRIGGRLQGANHPRSRCDGTFLPDFHGVIETDDGATIMLDVRGFGRAYPRGKRQVVLTVTHLSDDEAYRWLNDVVCVAAGEIRSWRSHDASKEIELLIDVAELVWEPVEAPSARMTKTVASH